jgi:hypothetical protein
MIPEYMFYDGAREDENISIDIGEFVEKRVSAGANTLADLDPAGTSIRRNSRRSS